MYASAYATCLFQVTVRREGSCAQYGMLAVDNIGEGEVLFQIPRNMLLHPGTTAIQTLLEEGKSIYGKYLSVI